MHNDGGFIKITLIILYRAPLANFDSTWQLRACLILNINTNLLTLKACYDERCLRFYMVIYLFSYNAHIVQIHIQCYKPIKSELPHTVKVSLRCPIKSSGHPEGKSVIIEIWTKYNVFYVDILKGKVLLLKYELSIMCSMWTSWREKCYYWNMN